MFGKTKHPKSKPVVSGRGPGRGTGPALPDDDALAILDERIEKSPKSKPDIGIVIDPSRSTAPMGWAPEEIRPPKQAEPIFDPSTYTDFDYYCTKTKELFEPTVPSWIVVADRMDTPIRTVLECSYLSGKTWSFTTLWMRILLETDAIDLDLPSQGFRPGITLLDLVKERDK